MGIPQICAVQATPHSDCVMGTHQFRRELLFIVFQSYQDGGKMLMKGFSFEVTILFYS